MKYLAAFAALGMLAACGQPAQAPEAEAPPPSLMEQIQAQGPEQQLVTAYQALIAYQQAHPELQPLCVVRGTESRGVIPGDVDPQSVYGPLAGSAVYSVQCGERISNAPLDPREHWLVVYAPDATDVAVVNCADAQGRDACPREIPRAAAAPAAE